MSKAESRLLARIEVDADGCWLYTGPLFPNGYGQFKGMSGHQYAHRVAYYLWVGDLEPGLSVDHSCHNDSECQEVKLCKHRRCCNPSHLIQGTQRDNLLRGHTLVAMRSRQTHCAHGHAFTSENTRVKKNGCRDCKACAKERNAARGS